MAYQQQQHQLLMRLPDEMAATFRTRFREFEKAALKGTSKDEIKNPVDTVEFRPEDPSKPSNEFIFSFDGQEYPALLINLPTLMESHKTFNNKIFLKSGDIGQMLQVFRNEKERNQVKAKFVDGALGETAPSGLCPPTRDIVKRRFARTHKTQSFMPFKVRQVVDEILSGKHIPGEQSPQTTAQQGQPKKKGGKKGAALAAFAAAAASASASAPAQAEVQPKAAEFSVQTVVEEVVDFQDWMVDDTHPGGVSITLDGVSWDEAQLRLLLQHPEALLTGLDLEDDELEQAYALAMQESKRNESMAKEKDKKDRAKKSLAAHAVIEPQPAVVVAAAGSSSSSSSSSIPGAVPEKVDVIQVVDADREDQVSKNNEQLLASLVEQIGDLEYDEDDDDDEDNEDNHDNNNDDILVVVEAEAAKQGDPEMETEDNMELEEKDRNSSGDDDDDDDAWMKDLDSPKGKDS